MWIQLQPQTVRIHLGIRPDWQLEPGNALRLEVFPNGYDECAECVCVRAAVWNHTHWCFKCMQPVKAQCLSDTYTAETRRSAGRHRLWRPERVCAFRPLRVTAAHVKLSSVSQKSRSFHALCFSYYTVTLRRLRFTSLKLKMCLISSWLHWNSISGNG